MAINFTDFSRAPILDSPSKNLFENILKGYQISQEPAKMQQESSARELANKLREMEVEHKPKEYELSDKQKEFANSLSSKANEHYEEKFDLYKRAKEAEINKANRPATLNDPLAKAWQLKNSLDPQSPTYKEDLNTVNNRISKLSNSNNGIQVSTSPEGGVEVSVGGQPQGQTGTISGFPALPKGQTYVLDEKGKPMAVARPYSEAEKKEHSGREAFNIWQKFITESQAPYSGRGATKQFENDVRNYSTNPEAKTRIDNLLASDKLLFSTTVKEEATLGGANTNQAYNRITHSLENSEIFPLLRKIATYQLPQGYSEASSQIFNDMVNKGTEAGQNIPAFKVYPISNKKSKKDESKTVTEKINEGQKSNPEIISTENGLVTIKHLGRTFKIPEKLVDKFMLENSKAEFGGKYD